jgi:hypothetical protein
MHKLSRISGNFVFVRSGGWVCHTGKYNSLYSGPNES